MKVFGGYLTPPDWSQTIPDLITATVTGIVLAALVIWWDHIQGKRRAHDEAVRGWSSIRSRVRRELRQPLYSGVISDLAAFAVDMDRLLPVLDDLPLSVWTAADPGNRELVLAARLSNRIPDLIADSYLLAARLGPETHAYVNEGGTRVPAEWMLGGAVNAFLLDTPYPVLPGLTLDEVQMLASEVVARLGTDLTPYRTLAFSVRDDWQELRGLMFPE